jgi:hypothetical protein
MSFSFPTAAGLAGPTPKFEPSLCDAQVFARGKGMKFVLLMIENKDRYPVEPDKYINGVFLHIKKGTFDSELTGADSLEEFEKLLQINARSVKNVF